MFNRNHFEIEQLVEASLPLTVMPANQTARLVHNSSSAGMSRDDIHLFNEELRSGEAAAIHHRPTQYKPVTSGKPSAVRST